jgi:hypothetical protein
MQRGDRFKAETSFVGDLQGYDWDWMIWEAGLVWSAAFDTYRL